ncbi:WD repeat-containing protein 78 isoform X2 [Aplysia californica]|uniref:Dynein axonemal intermediate chain 4 n=1 Tax=Aplysia californica TaxID=6500 RepID=A0ABM0K0N6_APLCA|nr:WD repeat-containing protein 78 isoform X2 [Aplysia californica]
MSSSRQNKKQLLAPGRGYGVHDSNRSKNASTSKGSKMGGRNPAFASTRSTMVSSASKRQAPGVAGSEKSANTRIPVQIFDESGKDVTPLPLLHMDPNMMKKNQPVLGDSSVGTPTDLMSQASASIYGTQAGTATTSVFGGGPFTRSVFTQSYDTGSDSIPPDETGSPDLTTFSEVRHKRQEVQEIPTEEDLVKIVDITLTETDTIWMFDMPDIKVSKECEEATDIIERNKAYAELQKSRVGNDLYAERGMNTFNEPPKMKSVSTIKIDTAAVAVECTNWDMFDTYDALEKEKKALTEGDHEHPGVLDPEAKAKEEAEEEEGTISRPSSPKEDEGGEQTGEKEPSAGAEEVGEVKSTTEQAGSRIGSAVPTGRESRNTVASSVLGSEVQSTLETTVELTDREKLTQEWDELTKSEKLRHHLFLMERVVNLNTYQNKQALYRGFKPLIEKARKASSVAGDGDDGGLEMRVVQSKKTSLDAVIDLPIPEAFQVVAEEKSASTVSVQDMGPNLDRLWSYNCNLTRNKNVSCIAWNKSNLDLVAVGYGQFEFTKQKPGIVCCWCIKNPEYPERVFTSKHGVTALDFSTANANLLAVGYYDGGIAVYNVRKSVDEPVLDNFTTAGKHLAPVWQLKWIEKERGSGEERAEVLISISADGRVTQWSIRKGFESYDVMKLKKMPTRMAGRAREKKGEAFISRYAGGMCFDFHSRDSNIYLAGTEEGYIHKCSCSHNEQYLESYHGHTGPVYSIQWSPFVPDIFLSCSADWTIKLWHQDKTKPILSFHSCTKAVNDICWSPWSSTVFACVNEGAVEVWDLAQSTLDAVYTISPTSGAKQTSVSFSKNSQCLLVGDNEGQVTVYELRCMPGPAEDQEHALNSVIESSLASQLPGPTDGAGDGTQEEMDEPEM